MLDRLKDAAFWLADVSEHLRVSRRRIVLRRPGKGVDYTNPDITQYNLVERLHPKRMQLRVVDALQATPTSKTLVFERTDGPLPPFRVGQYLNLFVEVDGVQTSRPYSIASLPGDDHIRLTVKDNPGGFVAPYLVHELKPGDEVETTGPAGTFYYEPLIDGDDLVFLAGGSGITPFMSMIQHIRARHPQVKMHLLYGSRVPDDVIFVDELKAIAAEHPNTKYSLVISEPPEGFQGLTGFLDADLIRGEVGEIDGKTFYLCGPGAMYDFCLEALLKLGVPEYKIKRELYGPPTDVTQEPGWPVGLQAGQIFHVEVEGRKSIQALAGEPLMNTLERYGLVVPAICRVGECSACRVRLLAGSVYMPPDAGVRAADREHGYIHCCVAYPLEDLHIRLSG